MTRDLASFRTLVFDCDGVILDSNRAKTEAFRQVAAPWGEDAANALVRYHVTHGGVSRYAKFRFFIDELVQSSAGEPNYDRLLAEYAEAVRAGLLECDITEGLQALREATPNARWMVVSGGAEDELRAIFNQRGLAPLFDGGIFGSPDPKDAICKREMEAGNLEDPALFLGDSALDLATAQQFGMAFVFVSGWSEWAEGPEVAQRKGLTTVKRVGELLGENFRSSV